MSLTIVTEARTWLGTPWAHQGRAKGVAVDCVGLVVEVARATGVLSVAEAADYRRRPDGSTLQAKLGAYLTSRPLAQLRPGDVVLIATNEVADHVAFVGDYPGGRALTLIHAYWPMRKVVEHRLDATWRRRIVAGYSIREAV